MSAIDWSIKGPHFVNCNCDYGCPCQFNALPTYRTCLAVVAWQIDEGHFGDVIARKIRRRLAHRDTVSGQFIGLR